MPSPLFMSQDNSPVRDTRVRGPNSTTMVEPIGLSQPVELLGFSVDTSPFVDSPFESGEPVGSVPGLRYLTDSITCS